MSSPSSLPFRPPRFRQARVNGNLLRLEGNRRQDEVRRLRDLISAMVVTRLGSAARLPADEDIARAFHSSRNCVRLALQTLVAENRLHRSVGAGTYTTNVHRRSRFDLLIDSAAGGVNDDRNGVRIIGWKISTDIPEPLADVFPPEATSVAIFERLSVGDGVPRQLRTYYLALRPTDRFTRDDALCDLYQILENRFGYGTLTADRRISAVAAGESAAVLLEVETTTPILYMDTTVFDEAGYTVLVSHARYRSDMVTVALDPPRG